MKRYLPFLLFFSGCGLAYSAQIIPGTQIELMTDWSGGLNTASPANKIPKQFSPSMNNVFIHRSPGKILKRNGYTVVGSTFSLSRISYGFPFYHLDGSKEFILTDSSSVYSTKDFQTYTFISSAMNSNTNLECAQAGNKVFCTNGSDPVFTWDGTTKVNMDGTGSSPLIPKGRYITYFLNRIWIGNTAADNTSLDWSAVVSTGGTVLTPDNYLAWPPLNHHSVGLGDGEILNALWVYRGQLQIGKDNSIYTEFGNTDSSFIDRKTVSQAGCSSQDSVVILDGLTYYKGRNGIFSYDGSQSQRISDPINPDIVLMQDPTTKLLANIWDTQAQFAKGQFYGSTATSDGLLGVDLSLGYANHISSSFVSVPAAIVLDGSLGAGSGTDFAVRVPTEVFTAGKLFYPDTIRIFARYLDGGAPFKTRTHAVDVIFRNKRTGNQMLLRKIMKAADNGDASQFNYNVTTWSRLDTQAQADVTFATNPVTPNPVYFTEEDLQNNNFTIQITTGPPNSWSMADNAQILFSTVDAQSDITLIAGTTAQYISDVATNSMITAWSNFNSVNAFNGGTIQLYVRSSTSVINISTQAWKPINSGSVINEPILNNFIQWASTLSGVSLSPTIDNVVITHIEGTGSVNRPFATDWNNEYWLTISTDLTSNLKKQYVKSWITNSNPHAWMTMSNMNIASIWKDGNTTLYGGSSSTGTIFRLDFGTNDNGSAIDAFYDTPELTLKGKLSGGFDGNWMEEQLQEYWVDADAESGNILRVIMTYDGSNSKELDFNLTGTATRVLKINYNLSTFAKYFKFRFENNQLDKKLAFNNFALIYTPLDTR